MTKYLQGSALDGYEEEKRRTRHKSKRKMIWNGDLFHRRVSGVMDVPPHFRRTEILKYYHEGTGHGNTNATKNFTMEQIWWPVVYNMVRSYFKSFENCQRMSRVPT